MIKIVYMDNKDERKRTILYYYDHSDYSLQLSAISLQKLFQYMLLLLLCYVYVIIIIITCVYIISDMSYMPYMSLFIYG